MDSQDCWVSLDMLALMGDQDQRVRLENLATSSALSPLEELGCQACKERWAPREGQGVRGRKACLEDPDFLALVNNKYGSFLAHLAIRAPKA